METTFIPCISSDRLQETFDHVCSFGPRWQGGEGEEKVRAYIEFSLDQSEVRYRREEFEYLAFKPRLADLVIQGFPRQKVDCQVLAYSGSGTVETEMVYVPEKRLPSSAVEEKIVLTDALKSYQAYPEVSRNGGAGFIFGNNLRQDLLRVGVTNYERYIGRIPGVAIGSRDTQFLRELATRGVKARLEVAAHSKDETGWNLVVSFNGHPDPSGILICSHYDSMWLGPHAFDNASGTAALLELIQCFKGAPYNLTFLLCGAEELGFWGSKAFASRHLEECKNFRAVVCLDGICSDLGSVEVGATEDLAPTLREIARERHFRVDQWSIPPRPNSDHLFFEKMGVPVFWLTSMDPFYHTAADLPEHVSQEKLARHTAFAAHVMISLATRSN